jgi:hypothetical protein
MFEFKDPSTIEDSRALLCNRIFKLIYQKNSGEMIASFNDASTLYDLLEDNIRNVYELIEDQIPFWAYRNLLRYGKDNYGFTEEEYETAIKNCITAIKAYYDAS